MQSTKLNKDSVHLPFRDFLHVPSLNALRIDELKDHSERDTILFRLCRLVLLSAHKIDDFLLREKD